jgi:hypothetical protein
MILKDYYTRRLKQYRFLTREEMLQLSYEEQVLLYSDRKEAVVRVKVNGKVRTWVWDSERIEVPWKYGMYDYGTVNDYTSLVKEVESDESPV